MLFRSGATGAAKSDVAEVSSRVEDCFSSRFFVTDVGVKGKEIIFFSIRVGG